MAAKAILMGWVAVGLIIGEGRSVAITDVPVPPLAVVGGFETLTDTLTALCLCPKGGDVGCHHPLAEVILSSGVVHEEHAVVDWFEWFVVHALIIGEGGSSGGCRVPLVGLSHKK